MGTSIRAPKHTCKSVKYHNNELLHCNTASISLPFSSLPRQISRQMLVLISIRNKSLTVKSNWAKRPNSNHLTQKSSIQNSLPLGCGFCTPQLSSEACLWFAESLQDKPMGTKPIQVWHLSSREGMWHILYDLKSNQGVTEYLLADLFLPDAMLLMRLSLVVIMTGCKHAINLSFTPLLLPLVTPNVIP